MPKSLNVREAAFVAAYLANGGKNREAARTAGYKGSPEVLDVTAAKVLGRGRVREAIEKHRSRAMVRSEITREMKRKRLWEIAQQDDRDRTSAVAELNRMDGDHAPTKSEVAVSDRSQAELLALLPEAIEAVPPEVRAAIRGLLK